MKMRQKRTQLLLGIGPCVLAVVLLLGFLLQPVTRESKASPDLQKEAASSLSINVLVGNYIKNSAMADPCYVPFFGSSEFKRFDMFHPSVLAERYKRSYRPFLLGEAGTQSLILYGILRSMGEDMRGRKAIFILSPQWFSKQGQSESSFELYYSPLQIYTWIVSLEEVDKAAQYYAKRLLSFSLIQKKTAMKEVLEEISQGRMPSEHMLRHCRGQYHLLSAEDRIFGALGIRFRNLKALAKGLPDEYDLEELDKLAWNTGEKHSRNNRFQIDDSYFNRMLRSQLKKLKGTQKRVDYRKSPEYSDFQLVLNEMARLDMDVLFVLPPVNGRWMHHTGLSQKMLRDWERKLETQLTRQGFHNILDLCDANDADYFMQDTIHLGWRGWVAIDIVVRPFLESKERTPNQYHTDDWYFTKAWEDRLHF
jgi:D-alanine transfer protein